MNGIKFLVIFFIFEGRMLGSADGSHGAARESGHEVIGANENTAGEQVFILQGNGKPVMMVPQAEFSGDAPSYMRMPTRDDSAPDAKGHNARLSGKNIGHKNAKSEEISPRAAKFPPLRFETAKISGKLRLPRVKFAKLGVPTQIRDEEPSLDFTGKSVTAGGL